MSAPFRLGILQISSTSDAAWRIALAGAAAAQDWRLVKGGETALSSLEPDISYVGLVRNAQEAQAFDAQAWVIMDASLPVTLSATGHKCQGLRRKIYRMVAERYAAASYLIGQGAMVVDGALIDIEFPGLGRVSRALTKPVATMDIDPAPVEIYRHVPPRAGAKATWPADIFTFKKLARATAVPPHIDLTGRGRVVVFGPRHDLPAGRWRVRAKFSVETEDSQIFLKFQWGVNEDLETLEAMLDQSGVYEVELEKSWGDPGGPAELRVWAANAHFVGSMEFQGAEIERLPDELVIPEAADRQLEITRLT